MIPEWRLELDFLETNVSESVDDNSTYILAAKLFADKIREIESKGYRLGDRDYELLAESRARVSDIAKKMPTEQFLQIVRNCQKKIDPHSLLEGFTPIEKHNFEWNLNLGLLMDIYDQTKDEELKKEIGFIAMNYLAKSAPIKLFSKNSFKEMSQLGFVQYPFYYREYDVFEQQLRNHIKMTPESRPYFFMTDSVDFALLLPFSFSVVTSRDDWSEMYKIAHPKELYSGDFSKYLEYPFLCDLTKDFEGCLTNSAKYKERADEVYGKLTNSINEAAQQILRDHPEIKRSCGELAAYLCANTICISRNTVNGAGVLKVLPLLFHSQNYQKADLKKNDLKGPDLSFAPLARFLNFTGLRLGRVNGTGALLNFMSLPELIRTNPFGGTMEEVHYAPLGKNTVNFKKPADFLKVNLIQNLRVKFETGEKPAHQIMGQAALKLVIDLLTRIEGEKWKSPLVQTLLVRLLQHLANANMHYGGDDVPYYQAIELVHAEIASLLYLFSPFKESDFEPIYREHLTHIPEELSRFVHAGVAKSAMNLFACLRAGAGTLANVAVGKNVYFDIVNWIGQRNTLLKEVPVDLYVGQFDANISIDPAHPHHYKTADVQGDVAALLDAQPGKLVVAIDTTIDYVLSDKGSALMKRFSKEIREGKLNLVFFRSGQKFDMLGQDNYYGAPYYMVHNGDPYWKRFDDLAASDTFKADPLTTQWFCLSNKVVFDQMEIYRKLIFNNSRAIIEKIPEFLKSANSPIRVSTADPGVLSSFIDIKVRDVSLLNLIDSSLKSKFLAAGCPIYLRNSFGFTHTNTTTIRMSDGRFAFRITPGISPDDVILIIEVLNDLADTISLEQFLPPSI